MNSKVSKTTDPKTIYEKYVNGKRLTNFEVSFGATHFYELAKKLRASGPVFVLAAREAYRVADGLDDIFRARSPK